jgi:hypothetical protein
MRLGVTLDAAQDAAAVRQALAEYQANPNRWRYNTYYTRLPQN